MNEKETKDIIRVWNEIEEVFTNFRDLSDVEIIEHKEDIVQRLSIALAYSGMYVPEDVIIKHFT